MSKKIVSEFSVQLCQLLDQASDKIDHCLGQLDDSQVWWRPHEDLNSVGNLILHICGNLQQWCVALLKNVPDTRDRESEFAIEQLKRYELEQILIATIESAKRAIIQIDESILLKPVTVQGFRVNVMNALVHTVTHFQGHTHQIILLTRLQKKSDYKAHWTPDTSQDRVPM